jgi:tRNA A-37 threonylcarbamoyl transferase component Bud32
MPPIHSTRSGQLRWWLEGKPTGVLEALMADPDGVLQGPGSVARSRVGRKRFYRVEAPPGEPALYVKVFTLPPGLPRLRYWLRPSKARREAAIGRAIRARGLEAAGPIAVGEERRAGSLRRSLSVIPERPGRDLRVVLSDPGLECARRRALLASFGALARRLHDAGIDQDDFSPNNFLVLDDGGFCLIDFERCHVRTPLGDRRWVLLAKLHRHSLGVSRTDRLRFLRGYLGADAGRAERRAAWDKNRAPFQRIRRRDARRAARAAFKVGRHIERSGEVWTVRGRESLRVIRLELGARESRRAWVTAHQMERLGLPALRPVRLGPDWIELEAPASADPPPADARLGSAARRFALYGRLAADPDWVSGPAGPLLRDPRAFRLEI